ncbi:MAG: LysM peptidoglycan-binding domain-containing protein [Deltaproteobacteria bacterium]|nr:LysM peptidoglycan-binding domain-containing protein [Deltaproteobacteria bacterium]
MALRNADIAREKKGRQASRRRTGKAEIPIFKIGAGLVALVIILVFLIPRIGTDANDSKIESIDTRLRQLERRLNRVEEIEKRLSVLDEKRTQFEVSLLNRIGSLENSLSRKKTRPDQKQDNLHKEAALKRSNADKGPGELKDITEKARYHQVRAGETLYRISLKYGLKVEDLRKLNKIGPEAVIHVGQKLIVSR